MTPPYRDRVLSPDEWPLVATTELGSVTHHLDPSRTSIAVVEDADGRIVACWAFFTVIHAEGLWIDPALRHSPSVARRLWTRAVRVLRECGATSFVTAAVDPSIQTMLTKRSVSLPQEYCVCLPRS